MWLFLINEITCLAQGSKQRVILIYLSVVIGTVDDDPNKYYPHDRKKEKSSSFSSESSNENIRSLYSY